MTNLAYFIAGYLVIFGLLGGYILRLIALKKRLEKENIELIHHSKYLKLEFHRWGKLGTDLFKRVRSFSLSFHKEKPD